MCFGVNQEECRDVFACILQQEYFTQGRDGLAENQAVGPSYEFMEQDWLWGLTHERQMSWATATLFRTDGWVRMSRLTHKYHMSWAILARGREGKHFEKMARSSRQGLPAQQGELLNMGFKRYEL